MYKINNGLEKSVKSVSLQGCVQNMSKKNKVEASLKRLLTNNSVQSNC